MGRMRLLDKVFNASASQVEGFCIVKSVGIKTNVKGAAYLDMVLADAGILRLQPHGTAEGQKGNDGVHL